MAKFEFELHFTLPSDQSDPEKHVDTLYEAGCDDALVGIGCEGAIALDFIREAGSAVEAIRSAIENVLQAIPTAQLTSASPDLVNLSDMPEIMEKWSVAKVTRQAMRKYAFGLAKKVNRPFPPAQVYSSSPLWHMDEVVSWMADNNKLNSKERACELIDTARSVRHLNASIERARNPVSEFEDIAARATNRH